MKLRATLLVLSALAFLALDASAQSRTNFRRAPQSKPAPAVYGGFERTKMLGSVRTRQDTAQLGSAARRALLTTGRLPASMTKPKRSVQSRR
ncbi:MAG TPA: hypothetical protein VF530_00485 [Planctomycetota bacterium]